MAESVVPRTVSNSRGVAVAGAHTDAGAMWAVLEFIRTGTVGGAALGSSSDEVRAALGAPPVVSVSRPLIWRYGALQITFERDRVCLIGVYLDDSTEGGPAQFDRDAILAAPDLDHVLAALSTEGMDLEPLPELTFPDNQFAFASKAGTTLVFDEKRRLVKVLASE